MCGQCIRALLRAGFATRAGSFTHTTDKCEQEQEEGNVKNINPCDVNRNG